MKSNSPCHGVFQFLYTQNPFYLISACLILYGVQSAFHPEVGELINPWYLMSTLCGYTLLLAVTAYLIITFGKVWDDARSIVLILLLMILAVSVSFDEIVNLFPEAGRNLLLFGFVFSLAITEGLLRGLRIRFPLLLRLPFYLILALFFFYPLFVSPEVTGLSGAATRWRIFLFPAIAGFCFLTLLPAVRQGSQALRENGTPWQWPWFPWAAFGVLAFGVCLRSYVLSVSFETSQGYYSMFGGYFLVPFLFAGLILLLEIGIKEQIPKLLKGLTFAAPLVLALAFPIGVDRGLFEIFLADFVRAVGSPVFLTLCGLALFYVYGWLRGLPKAEFGFVGALCGLAFVGPETILFESLTEPKVWPLAVVGCVELIHALIRPHSIRCLLGTTGCLIALTIILQETVLLTYPMTTGYHLILLSLLIIGGLFKDEFATDLRGIAALLIPINCLIALMPDTNFGISEGQTLFYPAGMVLLMLGYGMLLKDKRFLYTGLIMLTGGSLVTGWEGYFALQRKLGPKAPAPLVWGVICFVLAALISAMKGGMVPTLRCQRVLSRCAVRKTDVENQPESPPEGDK